MIGGIEKRLISLAGPLSMEASARAIRQLWPFASFENATIGERYSSFADVPFSEVRELFVYRDARAAHLWDIHGANDETANSMIHLLFDPLPTGGSALITIVFDVESQEMGVIVGAVHSALNDPLLSQPALAEAA